MLDLKLIKKQGDFLINISFKYEGKGVLALFGPTGAGKSSLVEMIAGLKKPDGGFISIDDDLLYHKEKKLNEPAHRRKPGLVFQDTRLFRHLSVKRNLLYGAKNENKLAEIVTLLEISDLLNLKTTALSGGQAQLVAIGRALLSSPRLLILDEALNSLDSRRKAALLPRLLSYTRQQKILVLLVSHLLEEVLALADHMVLIENGHKVSEGSPASLLADYSSLRRLSSASYYSLFDGRANKTRANLTEISPQKFKIARRIPEGPCRLLIKADDVGLALGKPGRSSFQNVFETKVLEVNSINDYESLVKIDIGNGLWALLTEASVKSLKLKEGSRVWALIKAVSVLNY